MSTKPPIKFQQFDPIDELHKARTTTRSDYWLETSSAIEIGSIEELKILNAELFASSVDVNTWASLLWLINRRLTAEGIGPAWRGIRAFAASAPSPPRAPHLSGPRSLGRKMQRNLMMRWIDLDWLRSVLGPDHQPRTERLKRAFAENPHVAHPFLRTINMVRSSGGDTGTTRQPHKVLYDLDVPPLQRLALSGQCNRDSAQRRATARRRVEEEWRPKMEALAAVPANHLGQPQVERRLIYCEAIELAMGSPSDAATIVGWMTGERVSRQTIHEMRKKLASQGAVKRKAWVSRT